MRINVIRSHSHNIYTETINKAALSVDDDKKIILEGVKNEIGVFHFFVNFTPSFSSTHLDPA